MAHELTQRSNGLIEMAYTGTKPWHNLGQLLAEDASIEEWTVNAGMDWRIQRSKVRYFADRDGIQQLEMPDQHVLFRSDSKAPLGLVSAKYKTVQPAQVLEFFRDLVQGTGFKLNTAGTLFGGKKFWALAKTGDEAQIGAGDAIRAYLLLCTSCDGSSATVAKWVAERVVCNNTLTMAMGEGGKAISTSHRQTFNPNNVKKAIGAVHASFDATVDAMQTLARVRISDREAETFVRQLLRPEVKKDAAPAADFADLLARPVIGLADTEADKQRAPRGEADILELFRGGAKGSNLPGVRGTAWGLLNAVTEHVDHNASARSDSHRLNSAWFNGGDDLKSECFQQLLAMAR